MKKIRRFGNKVRTYAVKTAALAFAMVLGLSPIAVQAEEATDEPIPYTEVQMGDDVDVYAEDYEYFQGHVYFGAGRLLVDNHHGYPCQVTLNVLIESNANYTTYRWPYNFTCRDIASPEDYEAGRRSTPLGYEVYAPNGFELEETEYGTVYSFTFSVLPGNYTFANPSGNGDIIMLTQGFISTIIDEGYYEFEDVRDGNYEVVTVYEGDSVQLYGILGSDEWVSDPATMDFFTEWARTYDASIEQYASEEIVPEVEVAETEPVETESDLINMDQPQETAEETVSENQPAEEVVEAAPSQPVEDTSTGFPWAVVGIVGVLAVVVAVFAVKKSK